MHPDTEYDCEKAFPNAFGQVVVVRYGRPDAHAYPGHGAFGEQHAWQDHGLGINAAGKILNIAAPKPIAGATEYFASFKMRGANPIRAFVRTVDREQTEEGHLDSYNMGLLTGFCKTGSEAGEGYCEPWVNQTLGN
ncbi:hypothetical protein ATN38_04300 [Rhodococcus sp. FH8]|nr:hypothetical protein [Rhodococcus sp. FH8]